VAEVLTEDKYGEIGIVVRVVWRSIRRIGGRSGQRQSRNALSSRPEQFQKSRLRDPCSEYCWRPT